MITPDWVSIQDDHRVVYWDGHAKGAGKRRFSRFKNATDAEAFAAKLIKDANRTAGMAVRHGTNWKDLCQHWVQHHDGLIPEGTMRRRVSCMNKWIIPAVGDVPLIDTTLATLVTVGDMLVSNRSSRSNFNSTMQTMSVVADWADARRALPESPFGADNRRKREVKRLLAMVQDGPKMVAEEGNERDIQIDMVPTWDDVVRLSEKLADRVGGISKSREVGDRYGRAVRIAAGTGLRLCELLALSVEQIDLANGILTINRQLDRYTPWDGTERMPTTPPKSGLSRKVVVWAKVRDDLVAAVAEADENGIHFPPYLQQNWWPYAWGRLMENARGDAEFPWHGHWLRHHYGSYSLAPRDVGGLGHADGGGGGELQL